MGHTPLSSAHRGRFLTPDGPTVGFAPVRKVEGCLSSARRSPLPDGPLIVQSDKTLLLEVDHELAAGVPQGDRAVRRARARPRARPHLPADAARACGTRGPPATTPSRWSTPCCRYSRYAGPARAAGRRRRHDGPLRPAAARQAPGARAGARVAPTGRCSRRCCARRRSQPLLGAPARRRHRRRAPLRARPPEAGPAQARLAGRGPRRLRRRRGARRSSLGRGRLDAAPLPARGGGVGFWHGGSGVVVLPCGAGKTIVGAAAMAQAQATTLILVTNTVSARQWKDELLKRTSLTEEEIGEYSGATKEIRPVTIATYQVMTTRRKGVYSAPRALRRPGLGPGPLRRGAPAAGADLPDDRRHPVAAAARPDRHAGARGRPRGRRVLPHRAEALRRAVEGHRGAGLHRPGRLRRGARDAARRRAARLRDRRAGGALPARCLHRDQDPPGRGAGGQAPRGEQTLVIGQYLDQLDELGERLGAPVIKGETKVKERERLFDAFRHGEIDTARRVQGRELLRRPARGRGRDPGVRLVRLAPGGGPAARSACCVRRRTGARRASTRSSSRDTVDQDFAAHRQRFLAEQGYAYRIVDADDINAA